jgi:hypothetical protein
VSAPRLLTLPNLTLDSRDAVAFSFLDRDGQSRTALDRHRIPSVARTGVAVEWGVPERRPPMPLFQLADLSGEAPFVVVISGGGEGRSVVFAGYRARWLGLRLKARAQVTAEKMDQPEGVLRAQAALLWDGEIPENELGLLPQTLDHHRRLRWVDAQMPIRRAFLPSASSPVAVLLTQDGCAPCDEIQRAIAENGCKSVIAINVGSDRGQALIVYLKALFGEEAVTAPALIRSGAVQFGVDTERLNSLTRACSL